MTGRMGAFSLCNHGSCGVHINIFPTFISVHNYLAFTDGVSDLLLICFGWVVLIVIRLLLSMKSLILL